MNQSRKNDMIRRDGDAMNISYAPLDEAVVLHALYHGTKPVGPYGPIHNKPDFSVEDALYIVENHFADSHRARNSNLHFDYVCGRPIKVTLFPKTKEIEAHSAELYNRNSRHPCAEIILELLTRPSTR